MSITGSISSPSTAMTLADFTCPGLIIPHLRGEDAAAVIQELGQAMQREQRVPELLPLCQAAQDRELRMSTDLEAGMAFPHARLPGLKELSFALGRSDEPLRWGAKEIGSVRLVFLMAVPAADLTQYLQLISGLARLAKDSRRVEKLYAAHDALQILDVLQQIELKANSRVCV